MITIRLVNYNKFLKSNKLIRAVLTKSSYATSTQPAVQNKQEEQERELKDFETLTNITRKPRIKSPQKPPFVKNLFLGIFDTDILTYPQLPKEDVASLEENVAPLEKLMKQNHMVDCNTLSDKHFRQNLADYKAIGLQASQFMDGRECNITESTRFLEALSNHKLRDNIIYNEQLGVQTLIRFANDDLKKIYLSRLMNGDSLSAFCITEETFSNMSSIKTKATLSKDKKTWTLNGQKMWVVNGVSADVLIVFALTKVISKDAIKEAKLTAFVVEKDFPGISCDRLDTDVEIANVTFRDTIVPNENIIGEINKGEEILSAILTDFRLSTAPPCITLTKNILNSLSNNILDQSNNTNLLHETDAVRGKIGEISTSLYAMESVLYLTTGLIDMYEKQDCLLEAAIVKIFCTTCCADTGMIALDLTGSPAMSESHWANKFYKESLKYVTLHETNDSLKILVALLGLQHAGVKLNEMVSKLRNPLYHGTFILKRLWTNRKNVDDDPKLDLELNHYLHPSLSGASQNLEYCVKRLQFITEVLLSRYGLEVVNKHIELRRLANCIVDIYVMTACLARASRSYCIGLQNSNYEMLAAYCFCLEATDRVKHNVKEIYVGQFQTNDENFREIAKNVFKFKGYFFKHPLVRNF